MEEPTTSTLFGIHEGWNKALEERSPSLIVFACNQDAEKAYKSNELICVWLILPSQAAEFFQLAAVPRRNDLRPCGIENVWWYYEKKIVSAYLELTENRITVWFGGGHLRLYLPNRDGFDLAFEEGSSGFTKEYWEGLAIMHAMENI